ncbi:MAG: GTPase ObgE [Verrucomicrobiae bacterium]|nr:GTPase ObgE [Verrucomicrobiae bacterium]
MFVDQIIIHAKAGDGGNGCSSFRREKYVPRGGPDGGDGGKGGDIVLYVDPNVNNLVEFKFQPILKAKHGQHGMGKQCYGKAAVDQIYKVPVGTVVYRLPDESLHEPLRSPKRDETKRIYPLVADLTIPHTSYILCQGGRGGRGNIHFKSSTNRAPRRCEEGFPGEEGRFLLEMKTIADIGLVGYPNAGKSTLLSKISAAQPKIASYPFTTLTPNLGVVELPKYQRFTVADIPGLVEGAHKGVGLGHDFLRHIERCKAFLFVLDMAGSEGRDPKKDFQQLRKELKLFRADLAKRPFLIAANKMDLPVAPENLKAFKKSFRHKIIPISANAEMGIDLLKKTLSTLLLETDS